MVFGVKFSVGGPVVWRAPCNAALAEGSPSLNISNTNNNNNDGTYIAYFLCDFIFGLLDTVKN